MALIKCIECGEEVSDTALTCPHCGFERTAIICPECGKLCNIHKERCNNCGYRLIDSKAILAPFDIVEPFYTQCISKMDSAATIDEWEYLKSQFEILGDYKFSCDNMNTCDNKIENIFAAEKLEKDYSEAVSLVNSSCNIGDYKSLFVKFKSFKDYKDSKKYADICKEKIYYPFYEQACKKMDQCKFLSDWENVRKEFQKLGDYRDSPEKAELCKSGYDLRRSRSKKIGWVSAIAIVCAVFLYSVLNNAVIPFSHYRNGDKAFSKGDYEEAKRYYAEAGDFRDANEKQILAVKAQHYKNAESSFSLGDYQEASSEYKLADDYLDATVKLQEVHYTMGADYLVDQDYVQAAEEFMLSLDYNNSYEKVLEIGKLLLSQENYSQAQNVFKQLTMPESLTYCHYIAGIQFLKYGYYKDALTEFNLVDKNYFNLDDSYINSCKLLLAEDYFKSGDLSIAKNLYNNLPNEFSYNGVSVSSRVSLLDKYSSFVDMCGKWKATGATVAKAQGLSKTSSYYNCWEDSSSNDFEGNLIVKCIINGDGTVTISGTVEYPGYYLSNGDLYCSDSSKKFSKTLSSFPNEITIADDVTLTYSNGTLSLLYYRKDRTSDAQYNWEFISSCTYEAEQNTDSGGAGKQ
ncbi:MAG: hypothetical protein VB078_10005 [Clostridiaceae bacterium]|nr:hypothetical protein [Clostridiaceae bacterium]